MLMLLIFKHKYNKVGRNFYRCGYVYGIDCGDGFTSVDLVPNTKFYTLMMHKFYRSKIN